MKKGLIGLFVLLGLLVISPVTQIIANAEGPMYATNSENDYVMGEMVTEEDHGYIVTLPASSFTRISIENGTNEGYLALRMTVKEIQNANGDKYCPIQISVNDTLVQCKDPSVSDWHRAKDKDGFSLSVEQKWGDYFFLPPGFDGTLYLSESFVPFTTITSLTIVMGYTHSSVINLRAFNTCSTIGEEENALTAFDFTTDVDTGIVNDSRVMGSASVVLEYSKSLYNVKVAHIEDDMIGGLRLKLKESFNGGQKLDRYAWIDFDVDDYVPSSGLALTVVGLTGESYFRLKLLDENGVTWMISITGGDINSAEYFPFSVDGLPSMIKGFYASFYLLRGDIGTLYVDYNRFSPNAAGVTMGKIVKISFGMDEDYRLGDCLAVNTFADVDVPNGTVQRLLSVSELPDEEISFSAANTIISCSEPQEYIDNFIYGRLTSKDLVFDTGTTIQSPLRGYLTEVETLYEGKTGCSASVSSACVLPALAIVSLLIFKRKKGEK